MIVIIGILAAIAIPMYLGQRDRAKNATAVDGGRTIMIAVLTYAARPGRRRHLAGNCRQGAAGRGGRHHGLRTGRQDPFANGAEMQPVAGPGDTTPGRYLYREAPGHAQSGRHQIVVYRRTRTRSSFL